MRSLVGVASARIRLRRLPAAGSRALPPHPASIALAGACALAHCCVAARAAIAAGAAMRASRWHCGAVLGFGYAAWRAEARLADALPPRVGRRRHSRSSASSTICRRIGRRARASRSPSSASLHAATPSCRRDSRSPGSRRAQDGAADADARSSTPASAGNSTVRLKRPHGNVNPAGFDLEAWLLEHESARHRLRARQRRQPAAGRVRRPLRRLCPARARARARAHPRGAARRAVRGRDRRARDRRPARDPRGAVAACSTAPASRTSSASPGCTSRCSPTLAGGLALALARRSVAAHVAHPGAQGRGAVGRVCRVRLRAARGRRGARRAHAADARGRARCGLWLARPGTALHRLAVGARRRARLGSVGARSTPGFWLSFGAVGAAAVRGSGRLRPRDRRRAGVRALARCCATARMRNGSSRSASCRGTLALFQQVSLVAPLANAIAIPGRHARRRAARARRGIVVPLDALWQCAHAVLAPLMRCLEALSQRRRTPTWQQHAPPRWTVVVATARRLCSARAARRARAAAVGVALAVAAVRACGRAPPPDGALRITVLDVGQGLAVVVETRDARARLRHRPALQRDGRCRRAHRRAVPARTGCGALDALDRQPRGPRPLRRRAVAACSGAGRSALSSLPTGSSDRRARSARRNRVALRGRSALDWDGVRVHGAASARRRIRAMRTRKTNDLSCVVRIETAGEPRAAHRRHRGAQRERSCCSDDAAGRCSRRARRAASRLAHVVHASVRRRRSHRAWPCSPPAIATASAIRARTSSRATSWRGAARCAPISWVRSP